MIQNAMGYHQNPFLHTRTFSNILAIVEVITSIAYSLTLSIYYHINGRVNNLGDKSTVPSTYFLKHYIQ